LPKLSNFLKIVRQGYRTFLKKFIEIRELFGKKEGPKHILQLLIIQGTLPDFPKKARQGYRTFLKKFSKVIQLFKNCPAKSSDFLKIVRQG
jgi:type III secretory pathway component EscR